MKPGGCLTRLRMCFQLCFDCVCHTQQHSSAAAQEPSCWCQVRAVLSCAVLTGVVQGLLLAQWHFTPAGAVLSGTVALHHSTVHSNATVLPTSPRQGASCHCTRPRAPCTVLYTPTQCMALTHCVSVHIHLQWQRDRHLGIRKLRQDQRGGHTQPVLPTAALGETQGLQARHRTG